MGSFPGSWRCPGVENDCPLQYSCLENSMSRGAWWATVHGATKSGTWLSDWAHTWWFTLWICFRCTLVCYQLYMCICICVHLHTRTKSLQSWMTFCDPVDCSPPGPSVHGVLQARILEWIAISSSRGPSQLKDRTHVSCVGKHLFNTEPPGKPDIYIYIFSRCLLS